MATGILTIPRKIEGEQTLVADYRIAQVISAGVNRNGVPLPHLKNRMQEAQRMKNIGEIGRILIGNRVRSLADGMGRYLEENLYISPTDIDIVYGGWGTAGELLHGRRKLEKTIGRYRIPSSAVRFYVITTGWASERTQLIADWMLRDYKHDVIGTPDGRIEWINEKVKEMVRNGRITGEKAKGWIEKVNKDVESDLSFEQGKLRMYRFMSKIPQLAKYGILLDILEPFLSLVSDRRLLLAYAREFSKKLRGQEIYRTTEDVYD